MSPALPARVPSDLGTGGAASDLRRAFDGPWGRIWSRLSDWNLATDPRLRRVVARRLALAGGETVLDLGCGAGNWGWVLARLAPGTRVLSIDLSPAMLRAARARLGRSARRLFAAADGALLPLPAAVVDRVVLGNVVGLQDDPGALLADCARVLRPGGRLLVVDFFEDSALQRAVSRTLKALVRWTVPSSRPMVARHRRLLSAELAAELAAHGFGEVAVDRCGGANAVVAARREPARP